MLDAFPHQPMDFFGSLKSRLADAAVRAHRGSPVAQDSAPRYDGSLQQRMVAQSAGLLTAVGGGA